MKENSSEKIDPTKNSPIPENLELIKQKEGENYYYLSNGDNIFKREIVKTKLDIYKESNTSEEYVNKNDEFELERQNLKMEHFISLLVKGALHSSDLIFSNQKYLSRKIKLEDTENTRKGELQAEIFLLRYLFTDWDKELGERNIRVDKKGRFAHYDYGESFRKSSEGEKRFSFEKTPEEVQKSAEREIKIIEKYGYTKNLERNIDDFLVLHGIPIRSKIPEIRNELGGKSIEILDRLKDETFFKAIIKKSELNLDDKRFYFLKEKNNENRIQELRKILMERLNILIRILQKYQ